MIGVGPPKIPTKYLGPVEDRDLWEESHEEVRDVKHRCTLELTWFGGL